MNYETEKIKLTTLQYHAFKSLARGSCIKMAADEIKYHPQYLYAITRKLMREHGWVTLYQAIHELTKAGLI